MAIQTAVSEDGTINFNFTGPVPRVGDLLFDRPMLTKVVRVEWQHEPGALITSDLSVKVIVEKIGIRGS